IRHTRPDIGRVGALLAIVNLVFSALIIIGLPVVINGQLGFSQATGNRLYGYAQGLLAVGGLLGGVLSGVVGKRVPMRHAALLLLLCSGTLLPMGLVLGLSGGMPAYVVLVFSHMFMMALSTILNIQLVTYIQCATPAALVGKVMALLTCLVMSASPLGQAVYGWLFQQFAGHIPYIYFGAFALCLLVSMAAHLVFRGLQPTPAATPGTT
ncbi:MAG: MFS transporter, partial [Gemmiger sp.]|nr:MFS transporter [Gemmiger sp.]